ncbi:MAG: hypothetical protein RL091_2207, partial [Verrucomicrobiota bacterium]
METLLILLLLYLVATLIILPIWTIIKIRNHDTEVDSLRQRLGYIDAELNELRMKARAPAPAPAKPAEAPERKPQPAVIPPAPVIVTPPPVAPVLSVQPTPQPAPAAAEPPILPPVITPPPAAPRPSAEPVAPKPTINWEQFMGAKLFAWLGGLALFLGVAYFVKYSFEHDLIP